MELPKTPKDTTIMSTMNKALYTTILDYKAMRAEKFMHFNWQDYAPRPPMSAF